jgi:hypothetical protein
VLAYGDPDRVNERGHSDHQRREEYPRPPQAR